MADARRTGVLITRPRPGAEETATRVAALGLSPVLAPLLEINRITVDLPASHMVQALLVTSGNAVASLPLAYHSVPLLAVGDTTAARAREAGFSVVHSAGADAVALASLTAERCDPRGPPLLLATGQGQGMALAANLRTRGFAVLRRVVYASTPVRSLPDSARAALRGKTLQAALFFSAETAHQFVRLLIRARLREMVAGVEGCAIGAPAAAAIEGLPWQAIRCAAQPTQEAMLALLS